MSILSFSILYEYENAKKVMQESQIQTEIAYIAQSIVEGYKSNKKINLSQYDGKYDIVIKETSIPDLSENLEELEVILRVKDNSSLNFRLVTYIRK